MDSKIIILNGTSSSGKTSIVKALQTALDESYLDAGAENRHRQLVTVLSCLGLGRWLRVSD